MQESTCYHAKEMKIEDRCECGGELEYLTQTDNLVDHPTERQRTVFFKCVKCVNNYHAMEYVNGEERTLDPIQLYEDLTRSEIRKYAPMCRGRISPEWKEFIKRWRKSS